MDRAGGQSGQRSVHLAEKKWCDFSGLSLTVFDSVQYCHLEKIQQFSKWLKSCTFFSLITIYLFYLDSEKNIYII